MIENIREKLIFKCDKCGFIIHLSEHSYNIIKAVKVLINNGWKIKKNENYCKNCVEILNDNKTINN